MLYKHSSGAQKVLPPLLRTGNQDRFPLVRARGVVLVLVPDGEIRDVRVPLAVPEHAAVSAGF